MMRLITSVTVLITSVRIKIKATVVARTVMRQLQVHKHAQPALLVPAQRLPRLVNNVALVQESHVRIHHALIHAMQNQLSAVKHVQRRNL